MHTKTEQGQYLIATYMLVRVTAYVRYTCSFTLAYDNDSSSGGG